MMPQMGDALMGFGQPVAFELVKKTVVDHELSESNPIRQRQYFDGILEPLNPRELLIKPEGERKWKWWALFTRFPLTVDDVVIDSDGAQFRVMRSNNWSQAGYNQYEVIEGPGV